MQRLIYFLLIVGFISCEQKSTELLWTARFNLVGTQSSPRAADLNGDGVADIVLGAGRAELDQTDHGIIALDGLSGQSLWEVATEAQVVGSPTFTDITGDGLDDVIIGGRNHILKAIDGKTGQIVWDFVNEDSEDEILKYCKYNFYSANLIENLDGKEHPILLISHGGNWEAKPNDESERDPGLLMLIDAKSGSVMAADTMPDGGETYMSPVLYPNETGDDFVIFGTGGETSSGKLYKASIYDLQQGNLTNAEILVEEQGHGFISPPVLADINDDQVLDIVCISHRSNIYAINGSDHTILWQHSFEGYECSSSFGVGKFTDDDVPDFMTVISKGVWPEYSHGRNIMINGKTGQIDYDESLGCYSLTTPIAFDANRDGRDEALLSINDYDCDIQVVEEVKGTAKISNVLGVLNFKTGNFKEVDRTHRFRNIYATPWIGDLDNDNFIDIVYTQNYDPEDLFRFRGMQIKRISTSIKMKGMKIKWGEYMGSSGSSTYTD